LKRAEAAEVIRGQNAEFEIGLLHDQLKSSEEQREELLAEMSKQVEDHEELRKKRGHAEQRVERYGENPKLQADIDEASAAEEKLMISLREAEQKLAVLEADVEQKRVLLQLAEST